jgi:ribonuclease-3
MKEIHSFNSLYLEKTSQSFSNTDLAIEALTHDSMGEQGKAFERMEFLGDACLEMCIAQLLVENTSFNEGQMSQLRSRLTSRLNLSSICKSWNIEPWIRIGKAMDIRQLPNTVYADFFESLLGALYLDRGLDAVQGVCRTLFLDAILEAKKGNGNFANPKTQLQNWTMAQKLPLPEYSTISKKGPAHAPIYKVQVHVAERQFKATSSNVKEAEFIVASKALEALVQA